MKDNPEATYDVVIGILGTHTGCTSYVDPNVTGDFAAKLQAAVTLTTQATNKVRNILLMPGSYTLSSAVTLTNSFVLWGYGATVTATAGIVLNPSYDAAPSFCTQEIRGILFYSTTWRTVISVNGATNITRGTISILDCSFYNTVLVALPATEASVAIGINIERNIFY